MNQNIKETCDTIHEILETYASPNQNTPELNITINDSYINEIPTVEELMIDGSSETLGLFCEPNDDEDSEEDEDVYIPVPFRFHDLAQRDEFALLDEEIKKNNKRDYNPHVGNLEMYLIVGSRT